MSEPLKPLIVGCLLLVSLVVAVCILVGWLLTRPRRCRNCAGIDKRMGHGFCNICGDQW